MKQPKPAQVEISETDLYPFFKNEYKYRTVAFTIGMLGTIVFILAWRFNQMIMAFSGVMIMFIGAIIGMIGLIISFFHKNIKLSMHLSLIVMWLVLLPLISMSLFIKMNNLDKINQETKDVLKQHQDKVQNIEKTNSDNAKISQNSDITLKANFQRQSSTTPKNSTNNPNNTTHTQQPESKTSQSNQHSKKPLIPE